MEYSLAEIHQWRGFAELEQNLKLLGAEMHERGVKRMMSRAAVPMQRPLEAVADAVAGLTAAQVGRQGIAGRQVATGRPELAFSEFHPIHPRSECRACASAFSALVFFGAFTSAGNNAASAHIAASARFGLCGPV